MANYSYSGETNSKKIARIYNFLTLIDRVHIEYEKIVTTLSRDCADIPALLSLGLNPDQIWGFDIDKKSVSNCKERYPGVNAINDDIVNAFDYIDDHARVNLDLCCTIREKSIKHFLPLVKNRKTLSFSITALKGRDPDVLKTSKGISRPMCTKQSIFDRVEYFSSLLDSYESFGRTITPFPFLIVEYQSGHSPMIILNFGKHSVRSQHNGIYGENVYGLNEIPVTWYELGGLTMRIGKIKNHHLAYLIETESFLSKPLSISDKSAAALKAHYTRGTYNVDKKTKRTLDNMIRGWGRAISLQNTHRENHKKMLSIF